MLGEITDEVVPWEVNQQCNLMNAIFSQVVNQRVQGLRKEKCCGCKVDHPSQRRHECLMMSEEEGWISYGLEAIEHVIEKEILWKQFREAIRIMRLIPHNHANNHFQKLSSNHETTLELLMDLIFKAQISPNIKISWATSTIGKKNTNSFSYKQRFNKKNHTKYLQFHVKYY